MPSDHFQCLHLTCEWLLKDEFDIYDHVTTKICIQYHKIHHSWSKYQNILKITENRKDMTSSFVLLNRISNPFLKNPQQSRCEWYLPSPKIIFADSTSSYFISIIKLKLTQTEQVTGKFMLWCSSVVIQTQEIFLIKSLLKGESFIFALRRKTNVNNKGTES